jgi:hypothetical protein
MGLGFIFNSFDSLSLSLSLSNCTLGRLIVGVFVVVFVAVDGMGRFSREEGASKQASSVAMKEIKDGGKGSGDEWNFRKSARHTRLYRFLSADKLFIISTCHSATTTSCTKSRSLTETKTSPLSRLVQHSRSRVFLRYLSFVAAAKPAGEFLSLRSCKFLGEETLTSIAHRSNGAGNCLFFASQTRLLLLLSLLLSQLSSLLLIDDAGRERANFHGTKERESNTKKSRLSRLGVCTDSIEKGSDSNSKTRHTKLKSQLSGEREILTPRQRENNFGLLPFQTQNRH